MREPLSLETFEATMVEPMTDVTRNPFAAVDVDLWEYADPVLDRHFPGEITASWDVSHVLQNADGTYQHVLVGPPRQAARVVIVIGLEARLISGYFLLPESA